MRAVYVDPFFFAWAAGEELGNDKVARREAGVASTWSRACS